MRVLGISAFHRNSAAALVVDGRVVAAAREEHFTRLEGDKAFPLRAIRAVLAAGELTAPELDHVVFYEKPLRKFERVLVSNLRSFPRSSLSFSRGLFLWLGDRIWLKNRVEKDLGVPPERVLFSEHLVSQGVCAFASAPCDDAAVLVVDDAGEWATTLLARASVAPPAGLRADPDVDFHQRVLEPLAEVHYPHSLGLVASAVTQFLGFVAGEDEHKVEALGALGTPRFVETLRAWVPMDDGLFRVEQDPFRFGYDSDRLYEQAFEDALGAPRIPGEPLRVDGDDARDADLASSLQLLLEERVLGLAQELHRRTGNTDLCFAGALASNRGLLARLLTEGPFERVHVPLAPGKDGGAIGAALQVGGVAERLSRAPFSEPLFDAREQGARDLADGEPDELLTRLLRGESIGRVNGPLEFAPHSAGGRIALRTAGDANAREELLNALQHVEPFLPARLLMRRCDQDLFLDAPAASDALLASAKLLVNATPELAAAAPSAVLPDGRVWPQVIDEGDPGGLHELLAGLAAAGSSPLLLAADLQLRGSPRVRGEADAVEGFQRSGLDALFVADRVYEHASEHPAA